jgi:hypothetical protein
MKKLPPIYSQTMNKPFNPSDQYDKIEQIIGGPPVKSKSENGDDFARSAQDLEINRDWKGS